MRDTPWFRQCVTVTPTKASSPHHALSRQAGNPILAMEDQAKQHEAEKAAAAAKL